MGKEQPHLTGRENHYSRGGGGNVDARRGKGGGARERGNPTFHSCTGFIIGPGPHVFEKNPQTEGG